jgi:phosphohistidine phosphatase SixA
MLFKKIVIIRHGKYSGENLNDNGIKQIQNLLPKLKAYVSNEKNVLLISSSAPRAEDSVKILAKELNLPYETHESFWSDNDHDDNCFQALALIKQRAKENGNADTIILVTHKEYTDNLPEYILNDVNKYFRVRDSLDKGEMLLLDFENERSEFTCNN